MEMIDNTPRRRRLDLITDEEQAIVAATQKIEELGAHPLLTDTVTLLAEAQEKLADWVEQSTPTTLEALLRMSVDSTDKDGNTIQVSPEFRVAVQQKTDHAVHIIIHANGHDSDTLDLWVSGNTLSTKEPAGEIASADLEWSDTLLDGKEVSYEQAEKAAAELGEGWRLPTRQELESILDLSRHNPAIDTDKFPDTRSNYYWTSTPCAWRDTAVWCVVFGDGYVYYYLRSRGCCVRAVRSGQ